MFKHRKAKTILISVGAVILASCNNSSSLISSEEALTPVVKDDVQVDFRRILDGQITTI